MELMFNLTEEIEQRSFFVCRAAKICWRQDLCRNARQHSHGEAKADSDVVCDCGGGKLS